MNDKDNAILGTLLLKKLSIEQLMFILASDKLKQVRNQYPKHADQLIEMAKVRAAHIQIQDNTISNSVLSTLMEAPSYPLIMLWCLVGVAVNLSAGTLALICGAFGVFIVGVIGIFTIGTYRELKRDNEKKIDEVHLVALKRLCSEELLFKLTNDPEYVKKERMECESSCQLTAKPDKNFWPRLKHAVEISLIVSATLFTTYFMTIQSVLLSLNYTFLAMQLANPVGVGVALALSLSIGFYFAYEKYQSDLSSKHVARQQKQLQSETDFFIKRCEAYQNVVEPKHAVGIEKKEVAAAVARLHSGSYSLRGTAAVRSKTKPPRMRGSVSHVS